MINDIHKKMLNEILGRGPSRSVPKDDSAFIIEKDMAVRKTVADLYTALRQSGQPEVAVKLLAEHVAIMVDMINEFKGKK